jgi:imidazolonepropionase-like amidohydrolase
MNPDEHDALPDNLKKDESTDLGRAHFLWFQAMAEKGMKPMDAIMAATSNIARAYHLDREIGTLEPGKRADLLILDADPLADIMNVAKIATVMKDGLVVDRAALPLKRVLTRP